LARRIQKVAQAEDALEAQERRVVANVDRLKVAWKAGWTPARIVIAGLASGFAIGRTEPLKAAAKGSNVMQMVTMLSGLLAGSSAQAAASHAEDAADTAEDVAVAVAPEAVPDAARARVAAEQQVAVAEATVAAPGTTSVHPATLDEPPPHPTPPHAGIDRSSRP